MENKYSFKKCCALTVFDTAPKGERNYLMEKKEKKKAFFLLSYKRPTFPLLFYTLPLAIFDKCQGLPKSPIRIKMKKRNRKQNPEKS